MTPEPIRLALCITDLEEGGAERALVALATRLNQRGFQPVVYCLTPAPVGPRSLAPQLQSAGVEMRFLGLRHAWGAPNAVRRLTKMFRSQRPELVQTFLFHANLVGRLAARRADVRCIVSGIRVAERRRRWYLWADRWTSGCVDRHACVSQAVADFSSNRGGLPPERLVVIPNGVDVDRFDAARPADLTQWGVARGRRVVTCVGRFDPQKGLASFLAEAPNWLSRLPQHDLLLVGDGPQRAQLEQTRAVLGLAERVHFSGWQADVPGILRASDMLALPSRWEGMPNVVLEAMACGLPVAAADVEGVRELLGARADEQVSPIGDAQVMSSKIFTFASQPALATRLGAQNRQRALECFSLNRMVDAYAGLYRGLLSRDSMG